MELQNLTKQKHFIKISQTILQYYTHSKITKGMSIMEQNQTFSYNYCAHDNKEIEEIRKKYLPQSESKYDELKRLDNQVQSAGIMEALIAGIGGLLIFGLGMCFSLQVLASGVISIVLRALICIIGIIGMIAAYPVYKKLHEKEKEENTPRILQLTEELAVER